MAVDLNELTGILQSLSDEETLWYDRDSGKYIDDPDEGEDIAALPEKQEINAYGFMEDFIAGLPDGQAKEWLGNSIRGRGAFRRFRGTCERFGLLDDWYAFEEECYKDIARQWCDDNNIPYENYDEETDAEEEFDWNDEEQFKPRQESEPVRHVKKDPYRIVKMKPGNMNLLSFLTDGFDQEVYGQADENHTEKLIGEDKAVYAVSDNGRFAAYIKAEMRDMPVITEVYVRKAYRHQGIGKSLMDKVKEECGDCAVRTEKNTDAVKGFLQACGYDTVRAVEYCQAGDR